MPTREGSPHAGHSLGPAYLARWLLGLSSVCLAVEAIDHLLLASFAAFGYRTKPQFRSPILATSVSDFWSRRWNLNVHDWRHRSCYRPLARRRLPVLGALAAFVVSALLHFWFIYVALGLFWGLMMASYFVVQALVLLAESRFRGRPSRARRAFTIAAIVVPAPLFIEPLLRLFEC